MTESAAERSADAALRAWPGDALRSLLPVRSLGELTTGLAAAWLEATGAHRAFVFVPSPDASRLWGSLADRDGRNELRSWSLDGSDAALADRARALLGEWPRGDSGSVNGGHFDLQTVRFGDHERSAGVILFLSTPAEPAAGDGLGGLSSQADAERHRGRPLHDAGRSRQSGDDPRLTDLAELSGRLVEQAHLLERAEHGPDARTRLQAAKLEALAEFAAGAGHEINNPVATIAGRAQLLLRTERDPERRQALATIGGQAYRIRDMIGDLMLFGRPPRPSPESLDLAEAVRSVLDRLKDQAQSRGCTFELETGPVGQVSNLPSVERPPPDARQVENLPHVAIWADPIQLNVVISSLVQNSLDALPDGGPIHIRTDTAVEAGRRWAVLSVSDAGPGLSEQDREHLFDPFYCGRQAGRGLGFGLPKSWRIVSNHDGRIEVASVPGVATTFTVYWPAEPR